MLYLFHGTVHHMTTVQLMKKKSDPEEVVKENTIKIERHFGGPIAKIKCDNANDSLTKLLIKTFRQQPTDIRPTVPHFPQENAVAERLNRTWLNTVRATLHSSGLPLEKYWALCLLDTEIKGNGLFHDTIFDIPRRLWSALRNPYSPFALSSIDLRRFVMFGGI